jgi:hypothetical protein
MIVTTDCVFSMPVNSDLVAPTNINQPFQFARSVCDVTESATTTVFVAYNPNAGINSPADISVYGAFSAGEILIGFLLLLIVWIMVLYILIKALYQITTGKKYIEYSNGDVPITREL